MISNDEEFDEVLGAAEDDAVKQPRPNFPDTVAQGLKAKSSRGTAGRKSLLKASESLVRGLLAVGREFSVEALKDRGAEVAHGRATL